MARKVGLTIIILIIMTIIWPLPASYGEDHTTSQVPQGVYLKLTKDFYEHLRDEGRNRDRIYSNDPSQDYLKEIAVSARFVVETNLQILKQQERIIQLLQDFLDKQK